MQSERVLKRGPGIALHRGSVAQYDRSSATGIGLIRLKYVTIKMESREFIREMFASRPQCDDMEKVMWGP